MNPVQTSGYQSAMHLPPFRCTGHWSLILFFALFYSTLIAQPVVRVITIDGAINPASADYIHDQRDAAVEAGAQCLVIRLNTPGGLLKSTREIVSDFLDSPIPIVVYVSPGGAQAASAGVFVTMAAHIAVMAPGTNLGAAHPVSLGEQMDSVMMGKVTNDAAAFIRTISEKRSRNVTWAEDAVRKSVSITESEAVRLHVVDTIAAGIPSLLSYLDGKTVITANGQVTLTTRDAAAVTVEKSVTQKLLDLLADPNIAYIFMMLGFYGLLFELYNPGAVLPGVVGVISLIIAFYSLHTLPLNYAGLSLIIFAVILFLLDLKLPSHGILTVGGIVSLIVGSMMLFRNESGLDVLSLSWKVILAVAAVTTAFFVFAIGMGVRAQKRKPTTGMQGLIGETGEALSDLAPGGSVRVHGEIWNAVAAGKNIPLGTRIRVLSVDNFTLTVTTPEN
jgi:membrane-bound serine protease (ClpP class)